MEDRVDMHGMWELKLVSIFAYFLNNWKWAITLIVHLPWWLLGVDMSSIELQGTSIVIRRCYQPVSVSILLLSVLSK
jgi:hypothetical protein